MVCTEYASFNNAQEVVRRWSIFIGMTACPYETNRYKNISNVLAKGTCHNLNEGRSGRKYGNYCKCCREYCLMLKDKWTALRMMPCNWIPSDWLGASTWELAHSVSRNIFFNARNEFHISSQPCVILFHNKFINNYSPKASDIHRAWGE